MPFESFIAKRYLRTRRSSRFLSFMTKIAIGGVAIGTGALIITFTILDGFENELRSNIMGFAAHIRVSIFRNETIQRDEQNERALRSISNVSDVQPFIERQALIVTGDNIDGVLVKGVPAGSRVFSLRNKCIAGEFALDSSGGKPSVLISKRLAARLGKTVGEKIILVHADVSTFISSPKIQFIIRGIYETGMAEYIDDVLVFVDLGTAQRLLLLRGHISGYDVITRDTRAIDATVNEIQSTIGYPFYPRSIFTIYRNLFVWIALQQKLIPIVIGSLIIIAVFNVISTLFLFVIEKTPDIGILVSMGATRASIRRIFLHQALSISITGVLIGAGVAFALCFAQMQWKFFSLPQGVYYMTTVPILLSAEVFLLVALVAIALSVAAALIPAALAARSNPIRSLRFRS